MSAVVSIANAVYYMIVYTTEWQYSRQSERLAVPLASCPYVQNKKTRGMHVFLLPALTAQNLHRPKEERSRCRASWWIRSQGIVIGHARVLLDIRRGVWGPKA